MRLPLAVMNGSINLLVSTIALALMHASYGCWCAWSRLAGVMGSGKDRSMTK